MSDSKRHEQYLRDQSVKIGVCGALNVKGAPADIIDCLIIKQHSNISVLQNGVGREDTIVGLNNRGRNLWRGIHSEPKLRLLAIVH